MIDLYLGGYHLVRATDCPSEVLKALLSVQVNAGVVP
jgi:hypothetical protein